MGRRCCVTTCRNGGFDCDETIALFKVPNEQNLFEKWARIVSETGSELNETSVICERHFRDDQIKREVILRDSFGNIIFQRRLANLSLSKEAIPSIFEDNLEDQSSGKKRKKRKTVIADYSDFLNTGNFIVSNDGNLNLNYNNILVSFNEHQNNKLHFNVATNNLPSDIILSSNEQNEEYSYDNNVANINATSAANYSINGYINTKNNGSNENKHENSEITENTKSIISIYIKSSNEENTNSINGTENTNKIDDYNSLENLINKELSSQKVMNQFYNCNGLNLETPEEVKIILPEDEIIILNQRRNSTYNYNGQKNIIAKSGTINYPLPETNIQMNIRSFDFIFYNSHKIKLPNPMWGYHKNSVDKNIIIFSKAKWFKSDVLIPPIYEKQVIFHESYNIKIYINNKFSPLEVRRPKDVQEMEFILKNVDEIVVCCGGPNIGECDTAQCAQKDYAVNKWRHKLCPIILSSGESICRFCSTINQVVRYPKKKRLAFGRRNTVQLNS